MNTYAKILATTLPLVLFSLFATAGTTYYFTHQALTQLAETWLETRLEEAVQAASEQRDILYKYGLENVPASNAKAQLDAGRRISHIDVGREGYIFAVDTRGVIAMHPDERKIGTDVSDQAWFRKLGLDGGRLRYDTQGVKSLALFNYFEPWQWYILAVDPEREVYGVANRMRPYLVYLGIISSIVLAGALMLLTRKITAPLRELTNGAESIGKGDLETRIDIRSKDEFGRLASVFNEMAARIQASHLELESRVAARTAELSETNRRLRGEIEERAKAQKELSDREQNLKAILSASPIGIGLVIHRKLGWANETMYRMLGYENGDLLNTSAEILYPDRQEFERVGKVIYDSIAKHGIGQVEAKWVRKNGMVFDCLVRLCSLYPDDPDKGQIFAVMDISEAKRLEAELQRAKKMEAIGLLAGGVAHDLNNILSGIVSYPELLLLDLPSESPLVKPIATIKKSGEMAAAIVQDLLTMARRGVAVSEVVNLNQIVAEQMKSLEFKNLMSCHPNIQVSIALAPDLLNINGSVPHLSKSVMNLMLNAAEAMPEGGKIDIITSNAYIDRPIRGYEHVAPGQYVQLSIADTGVGLNEKEMERVFEPFYTRKKMGRSGSGLGMAVVWGTVKDHSGFIDIQSAKGVGTTFTLYFPATKEYVKAESPKFSPDRYKGNGEKLLVVDDADVQREIARRILEKLGYDVTCCSSGETAVEYLKDHTVDVMVLDMIMDPGMDGLDTYREILRFKPGIKVIIASGFSESERVKAAQELGAGPYIRKPYTIETIGMAVKTALAGKPCRK